MRNVVLKNFFRTAVVLAVTLLTSCGYHMGSMMHPQIKSIAIAEVRNETKEVLASSIMRKQLGERFQFDNSLKITTPDKADCILYCRILSVTNRGIVWKSTDADMTFRPSEFRIQVQAEFSVTIPGSGTPLVPLRPVSGSATYQFITDPAIGRENALQQACYRIAELIVEYTTEAW